MTITLPKPDKRLHPNGGTRTHYMAIARLKEEAQASAYFHTIAELNNRDWTSTGARLDYTVYYRTADTASRCDDDNTIAWMKAYRDGIADALRVDDKHFRTGTVTHAVGKPRVEIEITEMEQSDE